MRDFWLNDHPNEAKRHGDFKSWSYDGDRGTFRAEVPRVCDTHGIGENGSFNNENVCMNMAKLLFWCCAIKMETGGKTSHWINLEVRLFISLSTSSSIRAFRRTVFAKRSWKKGMNLICAHNTNNNHKTNIYVNKQTNSDDFTLHLYMSCYTHHVPMRWLKYLLDYDWERERNAPMTITRVKDRERWRKLTTMQLERCCKSTKWNETSQHLKQSMRQRERERVKISASKPTAN